MREIPGVPSRHQPRRVLHGLGFEHRLFGNRLDDSAEQAVKAAWGDRDKNDLGL